MSLSGKRTYVGFGFGAIQAGLFLYEAFKSGNFGRLVVAEIMPDVVSAVRQADGRFACNIAHADRIETVRLGPIEIENPAQTESRARLTQAIAEADEIGTAIPSIDFYTSNGADSLHLVLATGLRQKASQNGPPAVVYAAENHNHAAEILQSKVMAAIPAAERDDVQNKVRFLNTVIGKMSGVVTDPDQLSEQALEPVTLGATNAFLVEAFNRILISQIEFGTDITFNRGLEVFQEKADLLPFEEAKLYGHNATHALAAYLAQILRLETITDLQTRPDLVAFIHAAFIDESGTALVKKYTGFDPLFTPKGYANYADDLLTRMMNPFLRDTAQRVGRSPERKLGWDDRLVGTMRLALSQGITPLRYAVGASAALATIDWRLVEDETARQHRLHQLWRDPSPAPAETQTIADLIAEGCRKLIRWRENGFSDALPIDC